MGLRTTTASIGSTNAADMAPALTEAVSQAKISSPAAAASPRPEIVASSSAQQYSCSLKSNSINSSIARISKADFEEDIGETLLSSNGPQNGPLFTESHMDQANIEESNEEFRDHQSVDDTLPNIGDFVGENHQLPIQLVTSVSNTSATVASSSVTPPSAASLSQHSSIGAGSCSTPTTMGLQKDYLKDNAEMDQMLGDLATSGEIDLMQVFKSFESVPAGDNLCELAGGLSLFNDVDVINMGLEYVTTPSKDAETLDIRNEISKRQSQMNRKCDFLIRRLRKVQARYMGQHINEEVNSLFDYAQQLVKRKERGSKTIATMTPINLLNNDKHKQLPSCSMKSLIKRIDQVSTAQQSPLAKSKAGPGRPSTKSIVDSGLMAGQIASTSATGSASLTTSPSSTTNKEHSHLTNSPIIPTFDIDGKRQVDTTSGLLHAAVNNVANAIDSDATASSSGGESADEMITYNNPTQNSLSMKEENMKVKAYKPKELKKKEIKRAKRAAWRWARDRASIASRCSWLLSQISDLEYRVRQHTELHHQIKRNKGAILFEDVNGDAQPFHHQEPPPQNSINGYRGILPGNIKSSDTDSSPNGAFDASDSPCGSSRTRAFHSSSFKKRKLTQMTNLHTVSKKAARQSTVKCGCQWPLHPCALCTGRQDPTAPRDIPNMMSFGERIGLVDPGFHPVLSFNEDVSQSIHFESTMRRSEWQVKASRSNVKSVLKGALALQKQLERSGMDDHQRSSKHQYDGTTGGSSSAVGGHQSTRKYSKKDNLLSSSKLKKKAKKSKSKRNYSYMLNNKLRKKSLNSMASDLEHSQYLCDADGNGGRSTAANGALLPRSKTSSPTPGSSKHEKHAYYSERKNKNSYDIDNIVIPYSVAASTRIEVLQCKEIPTPKWRVIDDDDNVPATEKPENENTSQTNTTESVQQLETDADDGVEKDDFEDVSNEAILARHERALADERKKFSTFLKFPWSTRSRANRRIDSRAESSGANTPDRTSPAPKTPSVGGDQESIPSPAIPSPAAPSTPQTPLEHHDSATENPSSVTSTTSTAGCSTGVTTPGPSNGNIIPLSALRIERRRTMSLRKTVDVRDDPMRLSYSSEFKETIQPFEDLEFPLPEDLYETMVKMMPTLQQAIDEECLQQKSNSNANESTGLLTNNNNITDANSSTKPTNNNVSMFMNKSGYDMADSDEETESVESGLIDEDPNDPEWCEPPSNSRT